MLKRGEVNWKNNPGIKQALFVFYTPKTPKQAERELSVKKLNLKPLLENDLLQCLNPEARKGRFYLITEKAGKALKISSQDSEGKNWDLIGWVIASPRQRLTIIRVMDSRKFTSEEIRARGTQFNASITRISTKSILKELTHKGLVESELFERMRFYWLNPYGMKIKNELAAIAPISPLSSAA